MNGITGTDGKTDYHVIQETLLKVRKRTVFDPKICVVERE